MKFFTKNKTKAIIEIKDLDLNLVQDFVIEADEKSIHILNAVSPAFTSAFAFARWVCEKYDR